MYFATVVCIKDRPLVEKISLRTIPLVDVFAEVNSNSTVCHNRGKRFMKLGPVKTNSCTALKLNKVYRDTRAKINLDSFFIFGRRFPIFGVQIKF